MWFHCFFRRQLGSSFEKFVKDVLEDIESEDSKASKVEKKPLGSEKKNGARRGIWKRVKVQKDALEAAETQNIGKQIYNSIRDNEKLEGDKRNDETTTNKNIEIKATEITTTETPLEHVFSETTTVEPEIDEPKGMFDEARKALTALFSSEEGSEDVFNIEEAEDKLETIRDSTTTTEIPRTEESTTLLSTVEISTQKPIEFLVQKGSKQVKTSTRQKVTGEICFRGRCVKTDEKK